MPTAAIVTIGFTPDAVGNVEPSQTTRRATSQVSPVGSHAEAVGEPPMRAVPIKCAEA